MKLSNHHEPKTCLWRLGNPGLFSHMTTWFSVHTELSDKCSMQWRYTLTSKGPPQPMPSATHVFVASSLTLGIQTKSSHTPPLPNCNGLCDLSLGVHFGAPSRLGPRSEQRRRGAGPTACLAMAGRLAKDFIHPPVPPEGRFMYLDTSTWARLLCHTWYYGVPARVVTSSSRDRHTKPPDYRIQHLALAGR
ncbi:hypothetical protein B0I35DRAFT_458669 [Stachybotrys elegans]|uniref:Uncharacterized protein n=1 Tax=Stachybotrys elegans TaxID=80388 RepID=A0A8K0SZ21_9HYPO|nr:hypothetical protein B0I35DRAFT_458669 [Stachybotrys elegans]